MTAKAKKFKPTVMVLDAPPVRAEEKIVLEVTATVPQFKQFLDNNYGDTGSVYAAIEKAIDPYVPSDDDDMV